MTTTLLLTALLALAPRAAAQEPKTITILAAASLAEVLPKLADAWPSSSTVRVRFSFDSSSRIAKQAERASPGDALITADAEWMDREQARGVALAETRRTLAGNRLVVVVPAASKLKLDGPRALLGAGAARIALAGETVPAGKYARASLEKEGVWPGVAPKVVRGDSVRSALRLAALGEADAAIVYATDARVEKRVRVAFAIPDADHEPIVYPAAVLYRSKDPGSPKAFLDFCASPEAAAIWTAAGFTVPAR